MELPPGQVAESLPGGLDTSVGCQLKRNGLQYLLQDGVKWFSAGGLLLGNGHGDTVRKRANQLLWVVAAPIHPIARERRWLIAVAAVMVVACVALLVWFWLLLLAEGMAVPIWWAYASH
jgi:hypothetical protein